MVLNYLGIGLLVVGVVLLIVAFATRPKESKGEPILGPKKAPGAV